MSEDERDIDVESDEDDDSDPRPSSFGRSSSQYFSQGQKFHVQADKRAHHNALERKRRDHIKDSFTDLRDAVPELQGEKVASRAQILGKAAEYITTMRKKNNSHAQDIDSLKRQNELLEAQVKLLRKMRSRRRGASVPGNVNSSEDGDSDFDADGDTPDEFADSHSPNKKLKASRD